MTEGKQGAGLSSGSSAAVHSPPIDQFTTRLDEKENG